LASNPTKLNCGDGTVDLDQGEECDDYNLISGDGCNFNCEVEVGFTCPNEGEACSSDCSDDILASDEDCTTPGLSGCDSNCKAEFNW